MGYRRLPSEQDRQEQLQGFLVDFLVMTIFIGGAVIAFKLVRWVLEMLIDGTSTLWKRFVAR